jgi:hypothetical protein
MARSFNGTTSRLVSATTPVTATPLTLACWANLVNATALHCLVSVSDSAAGVDYFRLDADGSAGGDPVRVEARRNTNQGVATSSSGFTANTWFHACGVFTGDTSRAAFVNGANKGTNATSAIPTGIDRIGIGVLARSSLANFSNGMIAEVGIWNAALTDADVASLAKGASPLMIRPESLVFYAPLSSTNLEFRAALALTATDITAGVHPRIYRPY